MEEKQLELQANDKELEQTQIESEVSNEILENLNQTKLILEKQTYRFGDKLVNRIIQDFRKVDQKEIKRIFIKTFSTKITEELDSLFEYYLENETEFYSKILATTDLVFNELDNKRTQTIYLDNLIKKISRKEEDVETVFTESIKNKMNAKKNLEQKESEQDLSMDNMFDQFIGEIVKNSPLSVYETELLHNLAAHQYNLYKDDALKAIEKLLEDNKVIAIEKIEEEMDKKAIRDGKTSAIAKLERVITNNSLKQMEKLLINTVSKYKGIAEAQLKVCSVAVFELIFRILPSEYQDQKGLLEVNVDTNINEKLGKLLDTTAKKLYENLQAKNQDRIENELYVEKRYKQIDDYECNFNLIEKVYQNVLHEIIMAYDIPKEENYSRRLNLILLSEGNSTKTVLKNLIDCITSENEKNLQEMITEMNKLSQKAQSESYNQEPQKSYKKRKANLY